MYFSNIVVTSLEIILLKSQIVLQLERGSGQEYLRFSFSSKNLVI